MAKRVRPFLMFKGSAEEAMNFYVSLFPDGRVIDIVRYRANENGAEGEVRRASFSIADQTILCIDSPGPNPFAFTPSFTLFVECESDEEITRLATALGAGGRIVVPLGEYGFSRRYAWISDRFGVSWQISLPHRQDP